MILFWDAETSGLQRYHLPWDDPAQPHLLQLAAKLVSPDYRVQGRMRCLIKPEGWSIEPAAQQVHGISMADAVRYGVELDAALLLFRGFCLKAMTIVAHNANFDRRVISQALRRIGAEGIWWQRCGPKFRCSMEESTPICQIPGEFGFKFPSLEEAHRFFFPAMTFSATHEAEHDIDACERIFRALDKPGSLGPDGRPTRIAH